MALLTLKRQVGSIARLLCNSRATCRDTTTGWTMDGRTDNGVTDDGRTDDGRTDKRTIDGPTHLPSTPSQYPLLICCYPFSPANHLLIENHRSLT